MPYFTDETKFTLPVAVPKEVTGEGWVEFHNDGSFSHQSRVIKRDSSEITQYRQVKVNE